jgi:hypothetical protein
MGNYIPIDSPKDLKYDPHDTIVLFYDIRINRFIDSYGQVFLDIYRYLTPNQVLLFKENKKSVVLPDVTNSFLVELEYPDQDQVFGWSYFVKMKGEK